MTEPKTYDQGVSDCWSYLYYELRMKDLADEMFDWVYNQQQEPKTYDQGVSDCWSYLYYELRMKDLADEMFESTTGAI